jgi:hypothetical protein
MRMLVIEMSVEAEMRYVVGRKKWSRAQPNFWAGALARSFLVWSVSGKSLRHVHARERTCAGRLVSNIVT